MSINIVINRQEIVAQDGITILKAANRAEIRIPTLCHVQGKNADLPCELE